MSRNNNSKNATTIGSPQRPNPNNNKPKILSFSDFEVEPENDNCLVDSFFKIADSIATFKVASDTGQPITFVFPDDVGDDLDTQKDFTDKFVLGLKKYPPLTVDINKNSFTLTVSSKDFNKWLDYADSARIRTITDKLDAVCLLLKNVGTLTDNELNDVGSHLGGSDFIRFHRNKPLLENYKSGNVKFYFKKFPIIVFARNGYVQLTDDFRLKYYIDYFSSCNACFLKGHSDAQCPLNKYSTTMKQALARKIYTINPAFVNTNLPLAVDNANHSFDEFLAHANKAAIERTEKNKERALARKKKKKLKSSLSNTDSTPEKGISTQ